MTFSAEAVPDVPRSGPAGPNTRRLVQNVLALLMLVLEALTVGYLSGTWLLPSLCVAAALAAVFSRLRFAMDRQRIYDVMALVAVAFFIRYLLIPDNPRYMDLFASQPIALAVAEYALAMQVLQFFVQRRDNRLPFMFPGTGVIALTCAAIVDVNPHQREMFLLTCLVFAALAAAYCDFSRQVVTAGKRRGAGRTVLLALVLLLIAGLGWSSATALYRYERDLDELVRRWLMHDVSPRRAGVSESSRLGSVNLQKQQKSLGIMLRIRSKVRPDYFRVRAYDVFDGLLWLPVTRGQTVGSRALPDDLPVSRHGGHAFRVRDWPAEDSEALSRFEVWPDSSLAGSFPAPLNPVWLQTQTDLVTVDSHFILRSDHSLAGLPYTIDVAARPVLTDPWVSENDFLPTLTASPRQLDAFPEIRRLAAGLFTDCRTTQDRIDATIAYFQNNYSYSLRVDVPEDWQDNPVAWFLLEQPAAHCEFFASGAATLLRLGGVPCRYVTGFAVHEENRFSHEWVARNRDAHAWVEAWDDRRGWVTVEATVSGGVPANHPVPASMQFREFLATRFQQLRLEWQRKGFRGLVLALLRRFRTPAGLTLIGLLCAVGLWLGRRQIARLFPRRPVQTDLRLKAFQQLLRQVDLAVRRMHHERAPQQTLEDFAAELSAARGTPGDGTAEQEPPDPLLQNAASWYRRYARARYGPDSTRDSLKSLAAAADHLTGQMRQSQTRKPRRP